MGHVFKRPDRTSYVAQYKTTDGRWTTRSTHCTDKRAAEAVLARFERDAQRDPAQAAVDTDGASHPAGVSTHEAHTLDGALSYLVDTSMANGRAAGTTRMYMQKAGHVVRVLSNDRDVSTLTLDVVQSYVSTRRREGAALSTISKELITLRASLSLARSRKLFHGIVDEVIPALNVSYTPRERYLADEAELHTLLAQFEPHRALWVAVAVYTGARASEVAKLDWSDIRWTEAQGTIHIRGTKTRASKRTIPLADDLACRLFPLRRASGPVVGAWPNCRRDLKAACVRAGIAAVSPNDLRRTFASWLKQRGVDSAVVARLLGHSSTKMVDLVYGRLDMATLAGAMSVLCRAPGEIDTPAAQAPAVSTDTADNSRAPTQPKLSSVKDETEGARSRNRTRDTRIFKPRTYVDPNAEYVRRYFDSVPADEPSAAQGRHKVLRLTLPRRRCGGGK